MRDRTRHLPAAQREEIAEAVLRWQVDRNIEPAATQELVVRSGGRVVASLGGMLLEMAILRTRPDLRVERVPSSAKVKIVVDAFEVIEPELRVSPTSVAELVPLMCDHWRDGRFPRINYTVRFMDVLRIYSLSRDAFRTERPHLPSRADWTVERLLDHWTREIGPYLDSKGRW